METKAIVRKKLIHGLPTLIITLILAALIVLCAMLCYREYTRSNGEAVFFDASSTDKQYVYTEISMLDERFGVNDPLLDSAERIVYHFALDTKGNIIIVGIKESDFDEKLSELYEYTKGSTITNPGNVTLYGYATKIDEELYSVASNAWGTASFDYYFGSFYFNCASNYTLYILLKWGAVALILLIIIIIINCRLLIKKSRFNRCFKRLDQTDKKNLLLQITKAGPFSAKNEYLLTNDFIIFPRIAAVYTYRDVSFTYRKQKSNLFSGNLNILYIATADGKVNKAACLLPGKQGDKVFANIIETVIENNPDVMVGMNKTNKDKYKANKSK